MNLNSAASVWSENFRIRAYEVDPRAQLTIQFICNYLQEIAGNHALKEETNHEKFNPINSYDITLHSL